MKIIGQSSSSDAESEFSRKIKKAWIFFVLGCFAVSLVAGLITTVIPGCRCDEGAGCGGCGPNSLFEFLIFGGFIAGMFSLIFGPFVALAIGLIAKLRAR
ncbi:hypothetical protein [Ottowia testudinis]|uniref:Uncharacterized protein n=1 Tax=Ottowia testudinis TaxID=2816950 RepID=A0A975CCK0_9BURK|nr:hypothetical protein [Ottowia testudinis]QTD43958.1 hypothetical protein J1M35_12480 [Ottowia testudinis]